MAAEQSSRGGWTTAGTRTGESGVRRTNPPSHARRSASGPGRVARLRSIRLRLLLPVAVATIGLVALGTVQAVTAARLATDARLAAGMAATTTATVRLAHQLELETAESDALRQRGADAGASLLTAAEEQTDLAVTAFHRAGVTARSVAPALHKLLDAADLQVDLLAAVRSTAARLTADQLAGPTYESINASLLAIADAVPELMTDVTVASTARAAAAISAAEHLSAQERDLLRGVFRRDKYQPGELATLATLAGAQSERIAEFNRYATPVQRTRYSTVVTGEDVTSAQKMVAGALAADSQPTGLKIDSDAWYIAQSNTLRRLHLLEVDLAHDLDQTARGQQSMAQIRALVTGISTIGLVVLAFGTALALAIRTSRRLRVLRHTALTVAGVELPGAITTLTDAADPSAVRVAMQAASSRAEALALPGGDEIGEVGSALSVVHRQALRLAADQATLRLDVAALFVALSRRGQTLIQRQLRLLDEFERSETDPQTLSRLFSLDHLAARMRRNEENLLVLAGGEPGRRVLAPVPLIDLVRAAASEIEDFERVDATGVADVGVAAFAVRDVIHLLAELVENATQFSPPSSRVRVSARRSIDSVTVSVFDEGIGMPDHQVDQLNTRLARPTMLTAELAGTMGLLVVGRLAARHGIAVELRSSAAGGTVALVVLPNSLLTPAPAVTGHTAALLHPEPAAIESPAFVVPETRVPETRVPEPPVPETRVPQPVVPQPVVPQPATWPLPSPAAAPVPANDAGALPRRRPGGLLLTGSAAASPDRTPASSSRRTAPPDPDLVRARLSGLARGLAAADRRTPQDSGPAPGDRPEPGADQPNRQDGAQ